MDSIALILSIVGCLNWGLVGIFGFDLVAWLFGGSGSLFSRLVYTVVALSGLVRLLPVSTERCHRQRIKNGSSHIMGAANFY